MARKLGQTFIVVTHDRQLFGDVDKVFTTKDGRVFEGEEPSNFRGANSNDIF